MDSTPDDDKLEMFKKAMGLLDESKQGYDPSRGADLLRRAAEAGLTMAQVRYGVLCYYGKGVPKSHDAAFDWYARSLETGGHTWGGGFNIGDLHDDSDEFPKNPIEAAAWFALSLEVKEGPGRLAALLPQFGQADVARIVARTMTLVEMLKDKSYDERLRPMRGLSLEPPEGPHPEDTPVTMLSVLIPLHAAMRSQYSLNRLVHELRHGDSLLYGAFKLLNPEDHAKGQIPMMEPEFVGEAAGEPTALLYSSTLNFLFDRPNDGVTPVAMSSQKYLEIILQMGARKLRLDQSLFGELTLDISEIMANARHADNGAEKVMGSDELDGLPPHPPPFTFSFPHKGRTHVAKGFVKATPRPKSSPEEPQIFDFEMGGGLILSVTCDGVEQDSPASFEEAIVNHLNRSQGMRDGVFPEHQLLGEETFRNLLIFNFRQNVRVVRNGNWELARWPDAPRFGFMAMDRVKPEYAVFFHVEPRTRTRAGFVTAIIKARQASFERLRSVLENNRDLMSGLVKRMKLEGMKVNWRNWLETDDLGEASGRDGHKHPDGRSDHPLMVFHLDGGLSPQDREGAERMADISARLILLIREMERRSLEFQNREN